MIANNRYDFALVGSSLQAALIAGLLASVHKSKVCLFSDASVSHRLNREICVSVDCITRPETWQMLGESKSESLKLLTSIGGGRVLSRVNPLMVANSESGVQALAHMFHVARGCGIEVERARIVNLSHAGETLRIRGARVVERRLIGAALAGWLAKTGVTEMSDTELKILPKRGRAAVISTQEETLEANQVILADEQAIAAFAKPEHLSPHFAPRAGAAVLTRPIPSISERCIINPRDRFLAYGLANRSFEIIALASLDDLAGHIVTSIPDARQLRPSGQTVFRSVASVDGAPFVGKLAGGGVWAVGGFGGIGAFMSPGIARFLAGRASGAELEYFNARGGGPSRKNHLVAEFQELGRKD